MPLALGYVLRHFPVWFSFRGNNVVPLSSAKAASLIDRHLQDQSLLGIAREQLYWVSGKTPPFFSFLLLTDLPSEKLSILC